MTGKCYRKWTVEEFKLHFDDYDDDNFNYHQFWTFTMGEDSTVLYLLSHLTLTSSLQDSCYSFYFMYKKTEL